MFHASIRIYTCINLVLYHISLNQTVSVS